MSDAQSESEWFGEEVQPGQRVSTKLTISESYSGSNISMPVHVWRAKKKGPTVFVTGAIHGDEINGTGAIRHIIRDTPFDLIAGTLVLLPVVNILGFERHSRYLPDRRDLNRAFPGSSQGSLASRMAKAFFDSVVRRCDYGIDLHSAAVRRTNFPNVRANLDDPKLAGLARAFGSELIISSTGPKGSLRMEANKAGCAVMILEAGEVWKVEQTIVEYASEGVANALRFLDMVEGEPVEPAYRIETDTTKWVRATYGGFLEFHVAPGDIVDKDDPLATNTDLLGEQQHVILAPRDGIIVGMATIPAVAPGDPICHIAYPKRAHLRKAGRVVDALEDESIHARVRSDLSSSINVTKANDDSDSEAEKGG